MARNWLSRLARALSGGPRPPRRRATRPALEALEDRCLPSVNVLTYHNDNSRTGQNLSETTLTPADVNSKSFGLLFSDAVDGQIYAQPLYVSGLTIPGQGTHDVVFVATENDSVYAYDADTPGAPLWQDSFISPIDGITAVPEQDVHGDAVGAEVGITATPVIDPSTNTLYVVAMTKEVVSGVANYVWRLHALDVTTGAEKFGGPVVISAPGFVPSVQLERAALLLSGGVVYTSWTSFDDYPANGWVIGYNAQTLRQTATFETTPNGTLGTIWQSGGGPAADAAGNIYVISGNGTFDVNTGGPDYGDTFLRLTPGGGGLTVTDYFTPFNQAFLAANDYDLGSGGPVLLPSSVGSAAHPNLLISAGKEGRLYLVDTNNMGGFSPTTDNVVQEVPGAISDLLGEPAYFNGQVYFGGISDTLRAFSIANGRLSTSPVSQSSNTFGDRGASPAISANGTSSGIVWAVEYGEGGPAVLYAYDAGNLAHELYDSTQAGTRDLMPAGVKFAVPTVADGKVFVPTSTGLAVFGLLPDLSWDGGGITAPAAAGTGTPFTVTRTYDVDGSAAVASNFTISYYASPTPTFSAANSLLLGEETISAAADRAPGTHAGTSPALRLAAPGTWYVFAVLDSANTIAETNEANNTAQAPQPLAVRVAPAPPAQVIDNGQAGYNEGGSWIDYPAAGYGGDLHFQAPGVGLNAVSWQFSGLAAGTYDVEVTWLAGANRAGNASYQVYDGIKVVGSVPVNQQVAPSGPAVNGVTFQSLGTFTVTSGILTVFLTDNANGYVIADAARVAPAPAGGTGISRGPNQGSVPQLLDNGQVGYAETGTWISYPYAGNDGNLDFHAAGGGADTATWQFTSLPAGSYDVQVTWLPGDNRATNAPYQVFDGGTLLGTVHVNQQQAPSGDAANGVTFQSLGTFAVSGGTLTVVLSDAANGYVIADAVQVVPQPAVDLSWAGGGISDPTTADTSTPFTLTRTYTISGGAPPGDFTIGYYASADATLDNSDDIFLGAETIHATAAGTFTGSSPPLQLPSAGTYYLFARIDNGNEVLQTDATDDVAQVPQPVTVTGALIGDNGQPGYAEAGAWTPYPYAGYGGSLDYHAPGPGTDTATWQFTGLARGSYDVEVTWVAAGNRATNAPYRVYDGNRLLEIVPVNQQVAPAGPAVNGVVFQSLGTFTLTSGTLTVFLSDNANGYVIADAARVAPAPVPGPILLDNGQPGYAEAGTWAPYPYQGYDGSLDYHAPGSGANTATWKLTGLPAGTYDVQVTWVAAGNRADNAPYQVFDGSTLLGTVKVNQQAAPSGPTANGSVFQSLGKFTISSGTLTVVLSDNADGYVIADALRLVPS